MAGEGQEEERGWEYRRRRPEETVLYEAARKKKKLVERDTLARVLDTGTQED